LSPRLPLEGGPGDLAEQDEPDVRQRPRRRGMRDDLLHHDPGTVLERKVGDPSTDGGKSDRVQALVARQLQTASSRVAERIGGGASAQPHAGGVDNESRGQIPAARDGGIPNRDRPDRATFGLDRWATAARDGARDPAAEFEVIVRGVDDRVDVLRRQVALQDRDRHVVSAPAHWPAGAFHAMDSILAPTSARVSRCNPPTLNR